MADFCKQCQEGSKDFEVPEADKDAKFASLCEGCGWTITDKDGNCLHCMNRKKWNLP